MTVDVGQGLLNALIFMGPLAVIGGLVCMYLWERTCRTKLKVLLVKAAGGAAVYFVDKEGSDVTLKNPKTGWSGTWPISELATIPQPYPDLAGLLPRFLQREIQMAIFIEGDIEPLLNRSIHRENVASPSVADALRDARGLLPKGKDGNALAKHIDRILDHLATGPTRELIASPDWLSALKQSSVMKALASVSDDLLETLKGIRNQLARFSGLSSTFIYLGLALIVILQGFILYYIIQGGATDVAALDAKVDAIHKALGIK